MPASGPIAARVTTASLAIGTGGCSSRMQAASSMFVHFPLVPAWECLRCCRKWSARKNFLFWVHSLNLCTCVRCSTRCAQSGSGSLTNSRPQYPQESVSDTCRFERPFVVDPADASDRMLGTEIVGFWEGSVPLMGLAPAVILAILLLGGSKGLLSAGEVA